MILLWKKRQLGRRKNDLCTQSEDLFSQTDGYLVTRIRGESPRDPYMVLVRRHYGFAYCWALGLTKDSESAKVLVREMFEFVLKYSEFIPTEYTLPDSRFQAFIKIKLMSMYESKKMLPSAN